MVSGFSAVREEWKALNNTIGSWVKVREGEEETEGEALETRPKSLKLPKYWLSAGTIW